MTEEQDTAQLGCGPWARFVTAFRSSRTSRTALWALLAAVGLAVLAPWIANERPYYARFRDSQGYGEAWTLITPIAQAVGREARGGGTGFAREANALRDRLEFMSASLGEQENGAARASLDEYLAQLSAVEAAVAVSDPITAQERSAELLRLLAPLLGRLEPTAVQLQARASWPLFASISGVDIAMLALWIGVGILVRGSRRWHAGGSRTRLIALCLFALAAGFGWHWASGSAEHSNSVAWKERITADPDGRAVFALIAYGPGETDLSRALESPLVSEGPSGLHWCGTDALGRDQLARLLYAGRTSFAVAFLAATVILTLGAALGLAAGALRGAADAVVLRAIELLAAFPTLVLLVGLVALLPRDLADSPWTLPLAIAALGWTHVARLARAEVLRVSSLGFVQAATAAGFSRSRVILRHVLPNSLSPVWIAASFVLSANLVLESAAAFLGFGVQHPAPSFGALLSEARATQSWWLALFPGLWLFAAILSIHLVGEGVREALAPRREERAR